MDQQMWTETAGLQPAPSRQGSCDHFLGPDREIQASQTVDDRRPASPAGIGDESQGQTAVAQPAYGLPRSRQYLLPHVKHAGNVYQQSLDHDFSGLLRIVLL